MQQKLRFGTMLAFALKGTPIWRLIVTIILCALAFGMFGLAQSFASIDLQDMILQGYCNEPVLLSECPKTEVDLGDYTVLVKKDGPNGEVIIEERVEQNLVSMANERIVADLNEKNIPFAYCVSVGSPESGKGERGLFYGGEKITLDASADFGSVDRTEMENILSALTEGIIVNDSYAERYNVYGRMPQAKDEIALSYCNYLALQKAFQGKEYALESPEDLFGFTIRTFQSADEMKAQESGGEWEPVELRIVGVVEDDCQHVDEGKLQEKDVGWRKNSLCGVYVTEALARADSVFTVRASSPIPNAIVYAGYYYDYINGGDSYYVWIDDEEDLNSLREIKDNNGIVSMHSYSLSEVLAGAYALENTSKYVQWVAFALGLVSVETMYLFMSGTFAKKQNSLGLLQSIGADKKTIFSIFLTETLSVWAISSLLATVLVLAAIVVLNGVLPSYLLIRVFRLKFGFSTFVLMYGLGLLTAVLGAAIPIRRAAKKTTAELLTEMEGN